MPLIIFRSLDGMSSGKETALFLPLPSPPTDEMVVREAVILGSFSRVVFGELKFCTA